MDYGYIWPNSKLGHIKRLIGTLGILKWESIRKAILYGNDKNNMILFQIWGPQAVPVTPEICFIHE